MAEPSESRIRIGLFDGLSIEASGESVHRFKTTKATGVFALLALSPNHRVTRARLMDAFWDEAKNPAHSLNDALTSIRKALPALDSLIRSDGLHVWFDSAVPVSIDA